MNGADAETRAALVTAYIMGFAVLRAGLGSPALNRGNPELIVDRLGAAIQSCVGP